MKVLISQRAEDDLAHIYAYLAARNPGAAERFRTEAEKALALLGDHPGRTDHGAPRLPSDALTGTGFPADGPAPGAG